MELIGDIVNSQLVLIIPVALVLVCFVLVFTFGFKTAEQPPFDKLTNSNDDRKLATKKRKPKEKKSTANGHITNVESKSPTKKSPSKETPETPKQKKQENNKQAEKNKKNEAVKNKKHETVEKKGKKSGDEKPVDFDDGNWETVPSKADKKKKQDSPAKKDRIKKKVVEKATEIEKLAKEVVNNELREREIKEKENKEVKKVEKVVEVVKEEPKEVKIELKEEEVIPVEEVIIPVEPKKEKKKEKKAKKEIPPPPAEADIEEVDAAPKVEDKKTDGGVVFDELGDVWTEAKQPKKSKKKARRDN